MAVLPQEMVTRIGRAYAEGQKWLVAQGEQDPESIEVALAVEAHRWFWQPKAVRTVILANQRECTLQSELSHRVKTAWLTKEGQCPANAFVRDLYCLGNGEPEIVPTLDPALNHADQTLWYALAELAAFDDLAPKATLVQRLEWKVRLLRRLDALGVWVMETSLHGGRGERPLLRAWWEKYASYAIEDLNRPLLVAFGKTHYDELQASGIPVNDFVYHPRGIKNPSERQHQEQAIRHIHRLSPAPQN